MSDGQTRIIYGERKVAYSLFGEEGTLRESLHNVGVVFLENYENNNPDVDARGDARG